MAEEEQMIPESAFSPPPDKIKTLGGHNHVAIDEDSDEDDEEVCVPIGAGKSFLFGNSVQ